MIPRRAGLALLVVIGILGVLVVLGLTFVTMARLERQASGQRLNVTKALLLARSGVEDALARLAAGQDPATAGRYGGEDWNADGVKNLVEPGNEVYDTASLNVDDCPVRHALRPTFFKADAFSNPDLLNVESRLRGYSGNLSGDLAAAGNTYALKVEDESAKINVNGGFLDGGDRDGDGVPDHRDADVRTNPADPKDRGRGWNFQLVRILDILGSQPEVGEANLGQRILQRRPAGGYRSVEELRALIGAGRDLSPFLTVSSWVDPGVVHPNAWPGQGGQLAISEVKKTRPPLRLEEGGRPPVNLNAAPRAVLVSLLQGLNAMSGWAIGPMPAPCAIGPGPASAVAGAIVSRRNAPAGPFRTWEEFWEFLDGLVPSTLNGAPLTGAGNLALADLLKAGLDPNTQLNKQSPDQLMWRWVDKSDLLVWSTEGTLHPTGTFRISACGRLLGPQGRLLAEAQASGIFEAYRLLRQTSQKDFVGGRSVLGSYLSAASPAGPGSPPMTGSGQGCSWGSGQGLAVTTTPCPPTALPVQAAEIDGALSLASVDLEERDPPSGTLMFLHHFDDGWDADTPGATGTPRTQRQPGVLDVRLQTNLGGGVWPDPGASAPLNEPNTLLPEGAHIQADRSPSFQAQGNFPASTHNGDPAPSNHGVLSYWAKAPNFTVAMDVSGGDRIDFQCRGGVFRSQALMTGRRGREDTWGMLVKNCTDPGGGDIGYEREYLVQRSPPGTALLPGQRWHLCSAHFDTDEGTGEDLRFLVLGITAVSAVADPVAGYVDRYTTVSGEEMAVPGVVFTLGGTASVPVGPFSTGPQINSVLDEFAIADFGDDCLSAGDNALIRGSRWAADRYQSGRYYKGDDGAFLSASVVLAPAFPPARLLRAWWTQYLPSDPRQEIRASYRTGGVPNRGQARDIEPSLRPGPSGELRAWLELDLLDAGAGLVDPVTRPLAQGTGIQRTLSDFRYRVRFRTRPVDPATGAADPMDQPVLESPFFDDITFAWQGASGPRILAWEAP